MNGPRLPPRSHLPSPSGRQWGSFRLAWGVGLAVALGVGLVLLGVLVTGGRRAPGAGKATPPAATRRISPQGPTVLLVVLDTVRADHLSLCGYSRPTSPHLDRIARSGAVYTCSAYAPGSWTMPSHASFFTGLPVTRHRADNGLSPDESGEEGGTWALRPLADRFRTLAEILSERGYQTASLSGNPLITPETGLTQGFDVVRPQAPELLRGADLVQALEHLLDEEIEVDPAGEAPPLFLFVNIIDAHVPWDPVPEGLDWLPPREGFSVNPLVEADDRLPFARGELSPERREALEAHLVDAYDYAVHQADRTLYGVLDALERRGWLDAGHRLVVTSDHGEFLGEHGLLDHGQFLYEPNQRVPVVYRTSPVPDEGLPTLPSPLSALHVFHLLERGRLPADPAPPHAVAYPAGAINGWFHRLHPGSVAAALWTEDGHKQVWTHEADTVETYHLAQDPQEQRPGEVSPEAVQAEMTDLIRGTREGMRGEGMDRARVEEELRALGYLE